MSFSAVSVSTNNSVNRVVSIDLNNFCEDDCDLILSPAHSNCGAFVSLVEDSAATLGNQEADIQPPAVDDNNAEVPSEKSLTNENSKPTEKGDQVPPNSSDQENDEDANINSSASSAKIKKKLIEEKGKKNEEKDKEKEGEQLSKKLQKKVKRLEKAQGGTLVVGECRNMRTFPCSFLPEFQNFSSFNLFAFH